MARRTATPELLDVSPAVRAAAAFLMAVGFLVLLGGWVARVESLRDLWSDDGVMTAWEALGFMLAGASIWAALSKGPVGRRMGSWLGALAAAIGALILLEYVAGPVLGIDGLAVNDAVQGPYPGRPSPVAAGALLIAGLALALIDADGNHGHRPFVLLRLLLNIVGLTTFAAWIYGVDYLHGNGSVPGIALHAMCCISVLAVGVSLARPDRDPIATLISRTAGGHLARRVSPTVAAALVLLGLLQLEGERLGWYGKEAGTTLFLVASIVVLTSVVAFSAWTLNRRVARDEAAIRANEARFRGLAMLAPVGIFETDRTGRCLFANRHWCEMAGMSVDAAAAFGWLNAVHPDDRPRVEGAWRHDPSPNAGDRGLEYRYVRPDGSERRVLEHRSARRGSDGAVTGCVVTVLDVTEQREAERQREELLLETTELAHTDQLTGLPNRRSLDRGLARERDRARRSGQPLCIALLDVDHFKRFNDAHGHVAGDELLSQIGDAWSWALRSGDLAARYGGDEFAVTLPDCALEQACDVVARMLSSIPGRQTASAGIAEWDGSETVVELVERADSALYEAKRSGRNRVMVDDLACGSYELPVGQSR